MSLDDLKKQVIDSGNRAFNDQRERIAEEGRAHEAMVSKKEEDMSTKELAHARLHQEHLTGQMQEIKNDISRERASANPNRSFIQEREKQLHKLQNDHLHVQGEIMQHKGMDRPASHIRYNNPHYF